MDREIQCIRAGYFPPDEQFGLENSLLNLSKYV